MSPEEALALLPDESTSEQTGASPLPRSPLDAVRPTRLPCPSAWAKLAPRSSGLVTGQSVEAWSFAGVLFVRAGEDPVAFGRTGFLKLPVAYDDAEEFARWPDPSAPPGRSARALSAILGLEPILTERELKATLMPALEVVARTSVAERWRAPVVDEDELCFWAGERREGGRVVFLRANLATRWLEVESHGPVWVLGTADPAAEPVVTNFVPDPDPFDENVATDRYDAHDPNAFADDTEALPPHEDRTFDDHDPDATEPEGEPPG